MRVSKEDKEAIQRGDVKLLGELLEKEIDEIVSNLKLANQFSSIRFFQGAISSLEDVVKLVKHN